MKQRTRLRRTAFAAVMAALLLAVVSSAQVRTVVRDILYNADGTRAAGQIEVTWNAFTSADGKAIAAGKTVRRVTDGVLDISLVPNQGATPEGTSYAVNYLLANGTSYQERWIVPSGGPAKVADVRVSAAPAPSVTVSQQQLVTGSGMASLLALWRRPDLPAPTAAGQCFYNTTSDGLWCSQNNLTFAAVGGGAGNADISAVGNCATGAAFTGNCGNSLTFEAGSRNLELRTGTVTANRTIYLPDNSGTILLDSDASGSGALVRATGAQVSLKSENGIRFADQFPGSDASAKIAACIADLPAGGGTCNAAGLTGPQTLSSNMFAGAESKPVHLVLASQTFQATTSFTIPAKAVVSFPPGARLEPSQGVMVTIEGAIESRSGQAIFGGAGVVVVKTYDTASISRTGRTPQVDVRWWGCTGDNATDNAACFRSVFGRLEHDGIITAGQTTLTSASMQFDAADTGKAIAVYGAGASNGLLGTTIASVTSGTTVELAAAAGTTVTGAAVLLRGAVGNDRAQAVHIPAGVYRTTQPVQISNASGLHVYGDGSGSSAAAAATALRWAGPAGGIAVTVRSISNSRIHDFLIDGMSTAGTCLFVSGFRTTPSGSFVSTGNNTLSNIELANCSRTDPGASRALQVGEVYSTTGPDVGNNVFERMVFRSAATCVYQDGSQTVGNAYRGNYFASTCSTVGFDGAKGDYLLQGNMFQSNLAAVGSVRINPDGMDSSYWARIVDNYFEQETSSGPAIAFPPGQRTYSTEIRGNRIKWDVGSTQVAGDAAVTSGTTILTSATANFLTTDPGRPVRVVGAGVAGAALDTYIVTRTSATQVELATPASTTVSNAALYLGSRLIHFAQTPANGKSASLVVEGNTFDFAGGATPRLGTLHIQNSGDSLPVFINGNTLEPPLMVATTGAVRRTTPVVATVCTDTDRVSGIGADGSLTCAATGAGSGGGYSAVKGTTGTATRSAGESLKISCSSGHCATTAIDSTDDTVTISLDSVGMPGTYTKVTTDIQGRISSGAQAASSDLSDGATLVKKDATNTYTSGAQNFGAAASLKLPTAASLPTNCTVGDLFYDSDAGAGRNLYGCTGTDTWTLLGDGTSTGGGYDQLKGDTGSAAKTGNEAFHIKGTPGEINTVAADSADDTVTISIPATITANKTVTGAWEFARTGAGLYGLVTSVTGNDSIGFYSYGVATTNNSATYGQNADVYATGAGSLGDISAVTAFARNQGTGTVANAVGLHILGVENIGGGTITNAFGLVIPSILSGANNWAIRTGGGLVEFGDNLKFSSGAAKILNNAAELTLPTTSGSLALASHEHSGIYEPANANIQAHIATVSGNPHAVTRSEVGLSNVENTALSSWTGSSSITTIGTLSAGSVPWVRLTDVPSSFPPSTHASAHGNGQADEISIDASQVAAGVLAAARGGTGTDSSGSTGVAKVSSGTWSFGSVGAADVAGPLKKRPCAMAVYGSGTNGVLQDTDDEMPACYNEYGAALTIESVRCYADAGSPTVMVTITGGADVLTGNLTCGTSSWAAGTLSGAPTQSSGGTLDVKVISAGGTAKTIKVTIGRTL